jgi:hypothetical protein
VAHYALHSEQGHPAKFAIKFLDAAIRNGVFLDLTHGGRLQAYLMSIVFKSRRRLTL